MSKDYCIREAEISTLITKVEAMSKEIDGNGKPGLRDTVTEMNVLNKIMAEDLCGIKTSMSAFVKFQTEIKAVKINNDKRMALYMVVVGLIFTGINLFIK